MSLINTGRGTFVQRWRAGEPVDHRKLNQVVDQVNAMVQGANPPRQFSVSAIIFALSGSTNGTGIDGVDWQDMNVAGRAWAKKSAPSA